METSKKRHVSIKDIFLMIWIFIKATVIPKYAYRFRNMYFFLPVILLLISWVLIPIPIQSYMKKNGRDEFRNRNINYVNTIYNLDNEAFSKIQNLGLRFDLKIMYLDNEEVDGKELVLDQGDNKLYVVVDLVEMDNVKGADAHYDFANFFDTYQNDKGTNTLLVLYNSKFLIRSNGRSNYYYYQMDTFSLKDVSLESFANFLTDAMVETTINTYGWYSALYALLIPFAVCLFTFLIFKANSRIKKFRNYFNVAGIASIIPTILVFGLSWVLPNLSLIQYYAPVYIVYYFFFISVISFKREKVVINTEE